MNEISRRKFLNTSGKLLVGGVAIAPLAAYAQEAPQNSGSGHGLVIDATSQNRCVTCEFWGGMRKVSDDGKQVVAQSMGWCNNPDSPNHEKLTAADHHMKKPGVWKKWAVL